MQNLKIIIIGRSRDTVNYEKALQRMGAACLTTMNLGCLSGFDGLLLPGGGDIAPALFGQRNRGSRNIDVELDITQLQALEDAGHLVEYMDRTDGTHRCVRFCTSWSTRPEDLEKLLADIAQL